MEIIKEHSRNLVIFLIPTIIITVVLFIILGASINLIIGFIVLMLWSTFIYYFGVNRSLKKKELDKQSLIIYIVLTIIVAIFVFANEDLLNIETYISIVGLGILLSTFCYSFYSKMKEVAE